MLQSVAGFINYYESIRRRTLHFIESVPADKIDWLPAAGEFTFGDLIRHLAAAESMFTGAVLDGHWKYAGHAAQPGQDLAALVAQLNVAHQQAMNALKNLDDAELGHSRPTLNGPPAKTWRLLMAMVEHEIHHRSQLAMYLTLIQVRPPHIYGLGVEDVIALATG